MSYFISIYKQQTNVITKFCFKLASALFIFIFILYLCVPIYMGLYQLINTMDTDSYYRYASGGKFSVDMYFKEAQEKGTQVSDTLNNILPEDTTATRPQELFKVLLKNEKLLREALNENSYYMSYLESNNNTLDDVIVYMNKIVDLDETFLNAAIYISMLIFILILYSLYKWRLGIFVTTGVLYLILVVDSFMSGIFLDACYPLFQKMHTFIANFQNRGDDPFSYEDYLLLSKSILPATREAALTFVILDTVVQSVKNSRKRKRSSNFIALYFAIDETLNLLRQIKKNNPNMVITKLNTVNFEVVHLLYKEHKKDNYLREAKEKLDGMKNNKNSRGIEVGELYDRLSYLQRLLRKSEYLKNNIIR